MSKVEFNFEVVEKIERRTKYSIELPEDTSEELQSDLIDLIECHLETHSFNEFDVTNLIEGFVEENEGEFCGVDELMEEEIDTEIEY